VLLFILRVVRKLRHAKNDFFDPSFPLVTNFPKKEKFCVWTVPNSSPQPPPPQKRDVICERPLTAISRQKS